MTFLEFLTDALKVASALVTLAILLGPILRYIFRRQIRAFMNIGRKVFVIDFSDEKFGKSVHDFLTENKALKVHKDVLKPGDVIKEIKKEKGSATYALIYETTNPERFTEHYKQIVNLAIDKNAPLIVLCDNAINASLERGKGIVIPDHVKVFAEHDYYDIANSKCRLLTLLLSMNMAYPAEKK